MLFMFIILTLVIIGAFCIYEQLTFVSRVYKRVKDRKVNRNTELYRDIKKHVHIVSAVHMKRFLLTKIQLDSFLELNHNYLLAQPFRDPADNTLIDFLTYALKKEHDVLETESNSLYSWIEVITRNDEQISEERILDLIYTYCVVMLAYLGTKYPVYKWEVKSRRI